MQGISKEVEVRWGPSPLPSTHKASFTCSHLWLIFGLGPHSTTTWKRLHGKQTLPWKLGVSSVFCGLAPCSVVLGHGDCGPAYLNLDHLTMSSWLSSSQNGGSVSDLDILHLTGQCCLSLIVLSLLPRPACCANSISSFYPWLLLLYHHLQMSHPFCSEGCLADCVFRKSQQSPSIGHTLSHSLGEPHTGV